jgi:hypothetical protein
VNALLNRYGETPSAAESGSSPPATESSAAIASLALVYEGPDMAQERATLPKPVCVWLYGSTGMISCMKTTVNLPDELIRAAREIARRDKTTVTELIETGLRGVIKQRSGEPTFILDDASVDGQGLQPAFRGARWEQVRDAIYSA